VASDLHPVTKGTKIAGKAKRGTFGHCVTIVAVTRINDKSM
jgi:hypothetical protein